MLKRPPPVHVPHLYQVVFSFFLGGSYRLYKVEKFTGFSGLSWGFKGFIRLTGSAGCLSLWVTLFWGL